MSAPEILIGVKQQYISGVDPGGDLALIIVMEVTETYKKSLTFSFCRDTKLGNVHIF